jgi:hypothetical protein
MGTLELCALCRDPVFEASGNYELLPEYCIPAAMRETQEARVAGECHTSCLVDSGYGRCWSEWRSANLLERGMKQLETNSAEWFSVDSASRALRTLTVLNRNGATVSVRVPVSMDQVLVRPCALCVPSEREWNLVADEALVVWLQGELKRGNEASFVEVIERMGLAGHMYSMEAAQLSRFVFEPSLVEEWSSDSVSMRAIEYAPFPIELKGLLESLS